MASSKLPKGSGSKASSSFGSTESFTSDTASSVDIGSKKISGASGGSISSIPKAANVPPISLKISSDSVDDFAIDEKVWVNGSRPGIIRFIGETKFATGKWIGVQLTSPDGKNDGTVAGVRYFACPTNCGVFVKPQRLTKAPMPESVFQKRLTSPARTDKDLLSVMGTVPSSTDSDSASDITHVSSAALLKNSPFFASSNGGGGGGGHSSGPGSLTGINGRSSAFGGGGFKIGDRVVVNASSGTKLGTLMFLGETDFASGQWAGIELDDPVGKNDGSVAGKRYFDCKMKYGLFAPLHKISAAPLSALGKTAAKNGNRSSGISSKTSSISKLTSGRLSRADSQESVSSTTSRSSVTSSVTGRTSRSGIRLGVTSLKVTSPPASTSSSGGVGGGGVSSPGSSTKNAIAGTNAAILDALKEKDEHINQLLRERDLERGEFSRVAMQADELEEKVAALAAENARIAAEADEEICEMKRLNTEYEEVQLKLSTQLEEERRRVEDMQFRFEEESLAKAELEQFVADLKKQVDELKTKLLSGSNASVEISEQQSNKLIQEHSAQLKRLEDKLEEKETEIFALQEELTRRDEAVFQMEASTEKRKAEFNGLQSRLREIEHELEQSNQRSQRYMETIDELNQRVSKYESECDALRLERNNLQAKIKEYENRIFTLEERLISEVNQVKENSDQYVNRQITKLEAEIERRNRAEKLLEERLTDTKARHDKMEAEVNTLVDQLRDARRNAEEEARKRKMGEEKITQLCAQNQSLTQKVEDLLRKSGDNSDLLTKLNDELISKQNEFQRKERKWESELETFLRDMQCKENEIRDLKIDLENQKSIVGRFEKREHDVEKLIQANENKLKLTQSDCEDKQRMVDELKRQLKDVQQQLSTINKAQLSSKDEFESNLAKLTQDYNDARKEITTLNEELRKLKDQCFELESERDRCTRESDRHRKVAEEREKLIEKTHTEMANLREKFEDYRKHVELELESSKRDGKAVDELSIQLDRTKNTVKQAELDNEKLREENRLLAAKVDELQEDFEGMKRRHAEVLNEFEFECKRTEARAETAEKLAQSRADELQDLEHRQNRALEEYRAMAETEKRLMEQKLDELEAKIAEQRKLQLYEQQQRQLQEDTQEDIGNYEQQIEFLNSVIVDMQKKNDELRNRVQVLEEIGLGEFEHSFQSQVETTRRSHNNSLRPMTATASTMTNGHIRNLRKYCDICELFDAHDTEDCPQQSSTNAGGQEPGHTYNAVPRDTVRPYCTLCERFGHLLEQCPDNETF